MSTDIPLGGLPDNSEGTDSANQQQIDQAFAEMFSAPHNSIISDQNANRSPADIAIAAMRRLGLQNGEPYKGVTSDSHSESTLLTDQIRAQLEAIGIVLYEHIPKNADRLLISFLHDHGSPSTTDLALHQPAFQSAILGHQNNITRVACNILDEIGSDKVKMFLESCPLSFDDWDEEMHARVFPPSSMTIGEADILRIAGNSLYRQRLFKLMAPSIQGNDHNAIHYMGQLGAAVRIMRHCNSHDAMEIIFGDGESGDPNAELSFEQLFLERQKAQKEMVESHLLPGMIGLQVYGLKHFGSDPFPRHGDLKGKYFEDDFRNVPRLQHVVVQEQNQDKLNELYELWLASSM